MRGAVDLTGSPSAVCRLLDRPYDWRVRAVERIEMGSATSCVRRRSLLVAPLRDVLGGLLPRHGRIESARLTLPVASFPKGPLVDFDVTAADQPAQLLPRAEIAELEAAYVADLARQAGIATNSRLQPVVAALCGFDGAAWRATLADFDGNSNEALPAYLLDGLGEPVEPRNLERWRNYSVRIGRMLSERLGEPHDDTSAMENPVLVVPWLFAGGIASSPTEATALLKDLHRFVDQAAAQQSRNDLLPTASNDLLLVMADYGRHWDAMVTCEVPLGEPFTIKTCDRRSLGLDSGTLQLGGLTGTQEVVLADARTNHVTLRSVDGGVIVTDVEAVALSSDEPVVMLPVSVSQEPEVFAFYASDPDRDYRARLRFRLRRSRPAQGITAAFILIVTLAFAAVVRAGNDVASLTLLVVPTTFAASLLLSREQSSLSSRLKRMSSGALATLLTFMWIYVAVLYLAGQVR